VEIYGNVQLTEVNDIPLTVKFVSVGIVPTSVNSVRTKKKLGYCKQIRTMNYLTLFKDSISNRNVSMEYPPIGQACFKDHGL
jgi:hypothetical protein